MALDPEELKRRRQQRAVLRAQRKARKRKLILYLAAACLILAGCGFLIAKVVSNSRANQAAVPEVSVPKTVIHIAAAGDLNVTDQVVAAGGADYDYTYAFMDVAHLLADADLTVLNFEGNLCGAPYGSAYGSAPQGLVESLRRAGVDMLQLANSYAINQGMSGLAQTIQATRAAGLEPLGVYEDEDAFRAGKGYTIREVEGVRIAFVAFTKGMDGMALPDNSKNCVNVLYTDYESTYKNVDKDRINKILDAAIAEQPDVIIALLHWGSEFNDTLSTSQHTIEEMLKEKGVDAIIGTHSHYVQSMALDPESGMFTAYSLGDFYGDAAKAGTEYSVILDLEITKDNETGEAAVTGFSFTPIFTVAEGDSLRVVRIAEAMTAYDGNYLGKVTEKAYQDMVYALGRIADRTGVSLDTEEDQ